MTATSPSTDSRPAHGMLPGSHERPGGAECRCGASWDRYYETCPNKTREDLLALATKIDEARQAANAIHVTASQSSVYGDLSEGLKKVLVVITDNALNAEAVYDSIIMDGNTVTEALDWVAKNPW